MQTALQKQMIAIRALIIAEIENTRRGEELSDGQVNADVAFAALCESFGCIEPDHTKRAKF